MQSFEIGWVLWIVGMLVHGIAITFFVDPERANLYSFDRCRLFFFLFPPWDVVAVFKPAGRWIFLAAWLLLIAGATLFFSGP